jgi:diguanylate cyclase (GGDEF)-like protein
MPDQNYNLEDLYADRIAVLEKSYRAILEFINEIEQLNQFQEKIDITSNVNQIWATLLNNIRKLIEVETCALFLVDNKSHEFILKDVSPEDQGPLCEKEITAQIECGTFPWVIQRRQPAIVPPRIIVNNKTIMILPLSTIKRTLGAILIVTSIERSAITQENIRLLTMLSKQYSLVMENTLLYEKLRNEHNFLEKANKEIKILSITDPLTRSYNRGYLTERLPQEIKRAVRYGHSFSVIMCDIDHFKKINDTYGHLAGDQVLKEFVQCVTNVIRIDVDWLARYGGEEFLVVLPVTDLPGAIQQAERLRASISKRPFNINGNQFSITASFGVTGFGPNETDKNISSETLINVADQNLYQAKKNGRNMVAGSPLA